MTVATWYVWEDGRVLVNMDEGRRRLEHMRADPRVSLTVMDVANWGSHVSLQGRVVSIEDDPDLRDIDRISVRYIGAAVPVARPPALSARGSRSSAGTRGTPRTSEMVLRRAPRMIAAANSTAGVRAPFARVVSAITRSGMKWSTGSVVDRRVGLVQQQLGHDRDAEPAAHERLHLAQVVRADARSAEAVVGERRAERALAGRRAVLADQVAPREIGRRQLAASCVSGSPAGTSRTYGSRMIASDSRPSRGSSSRRDDEVELAGGEPVEQLRGEVRLADRERQPRRADAQLLRERGDERGGDARHRADAQLADAAVGERGEVGARRLEVPRDRVGMGEQLASRLRSARRRARRASGSRASRRRSARAPAAAG